MRMAAFMGAYIACWLLVACIFALALSGCARPSCLVAQSNQECRP